MSNALAIATVTAALRNLLTMGVPLNLPADLPIEFDLSDLQVTTQAPDKARSTNSNNQLNLFLYQTALNAALRNTDLPTPVRSGEVVQPPLTLDLHYILTAYGRDDSDIHAHVLLGQDMRLLYDHTLLGAIELRDALPGSTLHEQIERVRITLQPVQIEEVSKSWTAFQSPYRLSAVYQVGVVMIESLQARRSALPVLRRGANDQGVFSVAHPPATIREVLPPPPKPAAELGDQLTIYGTNFNHTITMARLRHVRIDAVSHDVVPSAIKVTTLKLQLPAANDANTVAIWAAGVYTLALVQQPTADLPVWTSNAVPFALAPQITITDPADRRATAGTITLTLSCVPQVRSGQHVRLLLADQEIALKTLTNPNNPTDPSTLTFDLPNVQAGEYVVRLRIDGADSIPFDPMARPLEFNPEHKLTVSP